MTVTITHSTAADGTFSTAGATAWDASHALAGVADVSQGGTGNASWTAGQFLYASGTTTLTQSAKLSYDGVNTLTVPSVIQSQSSLGLLSASLALGTNISVIAGNGSSGAGGAFVMSAGNGTGNGGAFNMNSGNSTGAVGGDFTFSAGSGIGTGAGSYGGGTFYINGGQASSSGVYGGDAIIQGGSAVTSGNEGGVRLLDGSGTVLAYFGKDAGTGASGIGLWGKAAAFNTAPQRTYGAVTGALSRAAFNTGTVTLVDLAAIVGQLIEDLRARGDIA